VSRVNLWHNKNELCFCGIKDYNISMNNILENNFMEVIHNKTGNVYIVLKEDIKNCTNAQDGQTMVLYTNGNLTFCREKQEFWQKFTKKV